MKKQYIVASLSAVAAVVITLVLAETKLGSDEYLRLRHVLEQAWVIVNILPALVLQPLRRVFPSAEGYISLFLIAAQWFFAGFWISQWRTRLVGRRHKTA